MINITMKLADVKAACTEAADTARNEWRKEFGRKGCLFPRAREVAAQVRLPSGAVENVLAGNGWEWDGTLATIKRAAAKAAESGELVGVYVDGGFDYADSPRAKQDGDYDAWVTDWSVPVWEEPKAVAPTQQREDPFVTMYGDKNVG